MMKEEVKGYADWHHRLPPDKNDMYRQVLFKASGACAECVRRARTLQIRELAIEVVSLMFDSLPEDTVFECVGHLQTAALAVFQEEIALQGASSTFSFGDEPRVTRLMAHAVWELRHHIQSEFTIMKASKARIDRGSVLPEPWIYGFRHDDDNLEVEAVKSHFLGSLIAQHYRVTGYVGKGSSCHVWAVQSIQMQDEGQKLCLKTFLSPPECPEWMTTSQLLRTALREISQVERWLSDTDCSSLAQSEHIVRVHHVLHDAELHLLARPLRKKVRHDSGGLRRERTCSSSMDVLVGMDRTVSVGSLE